MISIDAFRVSAAAARAPGARLERHPGEAPKPEKTSIRAALMTIPVVGRGAASAVASALPRGTQPKQRNRCKMAVFEKQ